MLSGQPYLTGEILPTVIVPLTAQEYRCYELVIQGVPEDLDEAYGLDYNEFPVASYNRDGLTINLSTEGNRVWAEYLVCRAEDIATWDTVPTKDRRHYLSLAKKIQCALESVGLECRRWWEAPRNLDEMVARHGDQKSN